MMVGVVGPRVVLFMNQCHMAEVFVMGWSCLWMDTHTLPRLFMVGSTNLEYTYQTCRSSYLFLSVLYLWNWNTFCGPCKIPLWTIFAIWLFMVWIHVALDIVISAGIHMWMHVMLNMPWIYDYVVQDMDLYGLDLWIHLLLQGPCVSFKLDMRVHL